MWPFNRGWPLNGGPFNRSSTVLYKTKFVALCHSYAAIEILDISFVWLM
jgi:hypothetical protein